MSFVRTFTTATALGALLVASPAAADLTAAQVWDDWRIYMEGMGYDVTATQTQTGTTLEVQDIVVGLNGGPDIDSMQMRLGSLAFVETGDGRVNVVMPDSMPIEIDVTAKDTDRPARIEMVLSQTGQMMTASGDPATMTYDYSADAFGLALTSLSVDGTEFDSTSARFEMTGKNLASQTLVQAGDVRSYTQQINLSDLSYTVFFKDPESAAAMDVNMITQTVALAGTSTLPPQAISQAQNMNQLLEAGLTFDGTVQSSGTETRVELASSEGETKIKTGSATSTLGIKMGPDGIAYDVAAQRVQIGAQVAGLPFPLFFEMAQTGFEMQAPVKQSDDPQDFALAFNLTEFTMSDIIWALFDPAGQLPRDPATIALDLSGQAKMLVDFLDPQVAERIAASGANAGELEALKIDRLTVDAVGAKLDATGDLTFDNTDKTTVPGFPKPVGNITIDLAGANALLDKLVAMGLLPSDQVMGARMMLGIFAVPGDGPDTLTSTIEFSEAGEISANGQRIK